MFAFVFTVAEIKSNDCDSRESSNVAVIHSVAQWQICLKDSVQLNQLLCLPFAEPQISRQVICILTQAELHIRNIEFSHPPLV